MRGSVSSGKRAEYSRYQRTVVGVGTAAAEEELEAKGVLSEAVADILGRRSFPILVLHDGEYLHPALLVRTGLVLD